MKLFPLIIVLGLGLQARAQLAVTSGGSLTITAGATMSYDGLALTPSANFNITNSTLNRGTTIMRPSTNPAISRVYTFSNPVSAYAGNLQMAYAISELNTITESDLQLSLDNNIAWTKVPGTLDTTDKIYTATGAASTTISELTLASARLPLGLSEARPVAFNVYPNPASDQIEVASPVTGTFTLIDAWGRTLKTQTLNTGLSTMNIQGLPAGTYWLQYQGEGKTGTISISKL